MPPVRPPRIVLAALLALLSLLAIAPSAGAAAHKAKKPIEPPAQVRLGRIELGQTPAGKPALLIGVRYPIQAADRPTRIGVRVTPEPGSPSRRRCSGSTGARLLTFRKGAADQAHATSAPGTAWPVNGYPPGSSRDIHRRPGSDAVF